jgi:hypothetical protein
MTIRLVRHNRHAQHYGEDLDEAPHSATSFPYAPTWASAPTVANDATMALLPRMEVRRTSENFPSTHSAE